MPYIDEDNRDILNVGDDYEAFSPGDMSTPGELNYVFTKFALGYMKNSVICYQSMNDVLGAFEGAKQEFYRRYIVPYENAKIKENGDVYQ